jgi:hypothetical protein
MMTTAPRSSLWVFVLRSGVHATVAGVLLALFVPIRPSPGRPEDTTSPLHRLEHALTPWVSFLIVPIFGFANAGVTLLGLPARALIEPVTLGVALGLFIGKQVGIFASVRNAAEERDAVDLDPGRPRRAGNEAKGGGDPHAREDADLLADEQAERDAEGH